MTFTHQSNKEWTASSIEVEVLSDGDILLTAPCGEHRYFRLAQFKELLTKFEEAVEKATARKEAWRKEMRIYNPEGWR